MLNGIAYLSHAIRIKIDEAVFNLLHQLQCPLVCLLGLGNESSYDVAGEGTSWYFLTYCIHQLQIRFGRVAATHLLQHLVITGLS